jgi:hypothetical protein
MKNILARGGIEFIAVLLGITGSLWIDGNKQTKEKNEHQIKLLEAVYEDIVSTEKYLEETRDPAFKADSLWMEFFSENWEKMNVDSVAIELSKTGTNASFHNTFFDYREFHPPISSIEMIILDGSLKDINNIEIRKKINKLVKTDLGFVLKNVQAEIDMQINFRNTVINQNDSKLARILSVTQKELKDRFQDKVDNYEKQIKELKYFLTKDYARTYLNLKNRNRFFIMLFIRNFKSTLSSLKLMVEEELKVN